MNNENTVEWLRPTLQRIQDEYAKLGKAQYHEEIGYNIWRNKPMKKEATRGDRNSYLFAK